MIKIGSKRLKVKLDMRERSVWNDSPSDVAVADSFIGRCAEKSIPSMRLSFQNYLTAHNNLYVHVPILFIMSWHERKCNTNSHMKE